MGPVQWPPGHVVPMAATIPEHNNNGGHSYDHDMSGEVGNPLMNHSANVVCNVLGLLFSPSGVKVSTNIPVLFCNLYCVLICTFILQPVMCMRCVIGLRTSVFFFIMYVPYEHLCALRCDDLLYKVIKFLWLITLLVVSGCVVFPQEFEEQSTMDNGILNPAPCSTLFVANLEPHQHEEEITSLFSA